VAAGLLQRMYGRREGDLLFERTLPPGGRPVLWPVSVLRELRRAAEAIPVRDGFRRPHTKSRTLPFFAAGSPGDSA
jgi:hypothetical protein